MVFILEEIFSNKYIFETWTGFSPPSGMLRDPPFGRQNDNKDWHYHAERSETTQ